MWQQEIPRALAEIITIAQTSAVFGERASAGLHKILQYLETTQKASKTEQRQKSYKRTRAYCEVQQKYRQLGIPPLKIADFRDIAHTVLNEISSALPPAIKKEALYRTLDQNWDAAGQPMLRLIAAYSANRPQIPG
jgi:endonuclease YncB( thermonuclease family)